MSKRKYTKEEMYILRQNKYVKKCSEKYITYTDEFKIKWLEMNKKWKYHKQIFREFWFPDFIINSEIPKDTFDRLRYKSKHKWIKWIISWKKWRLKKEKTDITQMTKDEYIKHLEMQLAIYEELKKYLDKNPP